MRTPLRAPARLDLGAQTKMVRLKSELQALKMASELAYSAMLLPENAPTASATGTIDFSNPSNTGVLARYAVTFTRTDGKDDVPYVDLTLEADGDTFTRWALAQTPASVTGRDPYWADGSLFVAYAHDTAPGAVVFYVDAPIMTPSPWVVDPTTESASFHIAVTAISAAPGALTIERLV